MFFLLFSIVALKVSMFKNLIFDNTNLNCLCWIIFIARALFPFI